MPIPLQNAVLYGPVRSRRYGGSLGVNPMPTVKKQCSLDCVYCQYGETDTCREAPPTTAELVQAIEEGFADLAAGGQAPDRITIAGNGEPTMHPEFHLWAYAIADARDRHFGPEVPIGLLSNGLHLHRPTVHEAIVDCIDDPAFKLEVGTRACFEAMYRRPGGAFLRVLDALHQFQRFAVQALFVRGPQVDNAREAEVGRWLDRLEDLKPRIRRVEVFTIAREPDPRAELQAIPSHELRWIAARARAAGHQVELVA